MLSAKLLCGIMFAEKNVLNYLCNLIILLHGGYPFLLPIFTYEKGHEYWKNEMIEMNILENKKTKTFSSMFLQMKTENCCVIKIDYHSIEAYKCIHSTVRKSYSLTLK